MDLYSEIKDYMLNGNEFDETLALRVVQSQAEKIPFYGEFLKKATGKTHFHKLSEVPPLPVDFFKTERLFTEKHHTGYFESSGTTGNKSKIYYNDNSLELYKISSLIAYPLKNRPVKTLIDLSKHRVSSLAFMVNLFTQTFGGGQIQNILEDVHEGDVLFVTALQLFELIKNTTSPIHFHITIVETGGYKKFASEEYNRFKLYAKARKIFPKATFYTEYGMTELFSQFYADEHSHFKESHFLKVTEHKYGYLKVFDFANLYHISHIIVPDIIEWKNSGFEYVRRDINDERGCSYTFG